MTGVVRLLTTVDFLKQPRHRRPRYEGTYTVIDTVTPPPCARNRLRPVIDLVPPSQGRTRMWSSPTSYHPYPVTIPTLTTTDTHVNTVVTTMSSHGYTITSLPTIPRDHNRHHCTTPRTRVSDCHLTPLQVDTYGRPFHHLVPDICLHTTVSPSPSVTTSL